MIASGTGHRPDKLEFQCWSGYLYANPLRVWIRGRLRLLIEELNVTRVRCGMAIGFDLDLADVCVDLGIPFTAAVPFIGQECLWRGPDQARYKSLLAKADDVIIVSDGSFANWKMHARNQWLVNHSDVLFAAWDGTVGGTASTVKYALSVGRPIRYIDPNEFRLKDSL